MAQIIWRKKNETRPMSPTEQAWVGALIEGEGNLYFRPEENHGHMAVRITVGSTDVETISTLLRLVGTGVVKLWKPDTRHFGKKPVWHWLVNSQSSVYSLLHQIRPWLTSKQDAANQMISAIDQRWAVTGG